MPHVPISILTDGKNIVADGFSCQWRVEIGIRRGEYLNFNDFYKHRLCDFDTLMLAPVCVILGHLFASDPPAPISVYRTSGCSRATHQGK